MEIKVDSNVKIDTRAVVELVKKLDAPDVQAMFWVISGIQLARGSDSNKSA